jgi:aminoglycoside phosphotransferase (APT) family kinase protein
MAATALPRSDVGLGDRQRALAEFLKAASGAEAVEVTRIGLLAGGAIQENWGIDTSFEGGRLSGTQRLVLRTDAATGVPSSLGRVEEFRVLKAAFDAGVTVAEPLVACANKAVIGRPFFVIRRVSGSATGRPITLDLALEPARPALAERLGRELARLQTIRPPRTDLDFLAPYDGPLPQIAAFRAYLDQHPNPRPALEWALHWAETHLPAPLPPVLCHRDFRTGNYMLDGVRLTAILDWEFAGWGDPDEDIGWLCCKGWRFGRLDREAGGIADREPFYRGYETESGRRLDPERIKFWEVYANIRWAIIALQQSDRFLIDGSRNLSTAITGRRATECELELLMLLDGEGVAQRRADTSTPTLPHPGGGGAAAPCFGDLPTSNDLLALARETLLDELAPLLPTERRRDAHLVATVMAIAVREREGEGRQEEVERELAKFYVEAAPHPPTPDGAGPSLSPRAGRGAFSAPSPRSRGEGWGEGQPLARFAADLRNGAFETSPSQQKAARAILWRLTIDKLREGNPQFLAANGFKAGRQST